MTRRVSKRRLLVIFVVAVVATLLIDLLVTAVRANAEPLSDVRVGSIASGEAMPERAGVAASGCLFSKGVEKAFQ